jgi:outer membrane protein TolC
MTKFINIKNSLIILMFSLLIFSKTFPQQSTKYLREYIEIGLKNNLELQSAKEILNVYDAKLSQSFSNFLPKVDISSRYTRAGGGRSFIFPLGTMMNPLYEALFHQKDAFKDEEINFIRPEEQDTKVELVQPIFNLAIFHSYKAQDNLYESALNEYKGKEISFIYSIKETYYNYAKALQLVEVQKSAVNLAQENFDVINKMFKVDKVPKTDVLRADVLLSENQQTLQGAINQSTLAKNFFNNMLNLAFETEINVDSISILDLQKPEYIDALSPKITIEQAMEFALSSKPELKQLEFALKSSENAKSIMKSEYFPTLAVVADYGFQGEKYKFDKNSDYWMVSGVFSWNIFSGLGSKAKVDEAEAQMNSIQRSYENIRQLTRLEVKNSFIDLTNNIEQLSVAKKRYISAEENFKMIRRRYEEGLAPFINLIDAQTSLDGAKANYVVTYYSTLIAKARLEKSMGAFYIEK